MAIDLRQQLAARFPQVEHQLAFYAAGSKHPPYNERNVTDTLVQFCQDILPLSPIEDPRKEQVKIVKGNFPKLIHLEHKILTREDFPANQIIESIEKGIFNIDDYDISDKSRIKTLFWLPEVVMAPDAIYRNGHKLIAGDEVYVRVYDKLGSRVKLLFTMDIRKNGRIVRTVPVTSFLTDPDMVINFITGQPLYRKP